MYCGTVEALTSLIDGVTQSSFSALVLFSTTTLRFTVCGRPSAEDSVNHFSNIVITDLIPCPLVTALVAGKLTALLQHLLSVSIRSEFTMLTNMSSENNYLAFDGMLSHDR